MDQVGKHREEIVEGNGAVGDLNPLRELIQR